MPAVPAITYNGAQLQGPPSNPTCNGVAMAHNANGSFASWRLPPGADNLIKTNLKPSALPTASLQSSAMSGQTIYGVTRQGTAQAGSTTSITLDSGANSTNGYYNGQTINIVNGAGFGQSAVITAYNGSTLVATIAAWTPTPGASIVSPDTTSTYCILPTNKIGMLGVAPNSLSPYGSSSPQSLCATGIMGQSGQINYPDVTFSFYHYGSILQIGDYGQNQDFDIWVDDQYVGHFASAITTGTCQSGSTSTTIVLASGASSTNGYYNQCYATITGGTGVVGETHQISGYVGSTKTATIVGTWSTTPDNTTTYSINESNTGVAVLALTGNIDYLQLSWTGSPPALRKIQVRTTIFYCLVIGNNDALIPCPPSGEVPIVIVGDSFWETTGRPKNVPKMAQQLARNLGLQLFNLSQGGTGWVNQNASNNCLPFWARIAPPTESWELCLVASAGTFTISVAYGGSTQTTGNLAYNANPATTIQTAIAGLSNLSGATVTCGGGTGGGTGNQTHWGKSLIICIQNASGATLSVNAGSLTGTIHQKQYVGDVAKNVPYDVNGVALPFILFLPGTGNDSTYSASAVQTNSVAACAAIAAKFPSAITIVASIFSTTLISGSSTIQSSDLTWEAAYATAAADLPLIQGRTPFLNTYFQGQYGYPLLNGSGTVASPDSGYTDILISNLDSGHPTGDGHTLIAAWCTQQITKLLQGL